MRVLSCAGRSCRTAVSARLFICLIKEIFHALSYFIQRTRQNRAFQMLFAASGKIGRVDKVIYILVWANKKDAMRRHSAYFIILFRFMAAADKRQWSSAASMPRRKTRVKLCPRFCAANVPSHQICRSFSASRYSGL